jgi:hypothetical protein
VRVLEAVGRLAEERLERAEQRRLGLDVVAVVRRQHLDLVEPHLRAVPASGPARPAGAGRPAPGEPGDHDGGDDDRQQATRTEHERQLASIWRSPRRHEIVC